MKMHLTQTNLTKLFSIFSTHVITSSNIHPNCMVKHVKSTELNLILDNAITIQITEWKWMI